MGGQLFRYIRCGIHSIDEKFGCSPILFIQHRNKQCIPGDVIHTVHSYIVLQRLTSKLSVFDLSTDTLSYGRFTGTCPIGNSGRWVVGRFSALASLTLQTRISHIAAVDGHQYFSRFFTYVGLEAEWLPKGATVGVHKIFLRWEFKEPLILSEHDKWDM